MSEAWLLEAYGTGIFPWPIPDRFGRHQLAWFSPDPRAIIELPEFHCPQRLARRIRRGEFSFTIDQEFVKVMSCCGQRDWDDGTWITPGMRSAYARLHDIKLAHSLEVWQDNELAGGVYGVAIGGYFSAESMFHRRTDASKAALYYLVDHLRTAGFTLLDVQVWSKHLSQFGAKNISRQEFLSRHAAAIAMDVGF